MTSPSYLARCVKLYVKRGFNEDLRTDTANPPTLSGTHGARNPQHIEKATGNTRTGAEHLSSLYTLVLGTTIGFLASVTAYTIDSVVHHDRASHFIEVLLSTPLTAGSYMASVVLASLIHGTIAYTIAASTYTLVALNLVAPTARTILLNSWIYTAALLMTILTSLASITVNFAATRLSMDPQGYPQYHQCYYSS